MGKFGLAGRRAGIGRHIPAWAENRNSSSGFQRPASKRRVGEDVFNSWFARLELEEIVDDRRPSARCPRGSCCSWIQSNYAEKILDGLQGREPRRSSGCISPCASTASRVRASTARRAGAASREADAPLRPRPRSSRGYRAPRGDALSGSGARSQNDVRHLRAPAPPTRSRSGVAKQVASAALNNTVSFNPVYIHSTVGLGKSHLLNAIAWAAGAAEPGRNIVYLTADHFMYHFITAVQRQSALAFKDWLRRVDLLLIDDMQFLQGKSATEFGHTLGTLLTGAKQVVVAGDAPPRDLEMLDERVRSRLSGGLVVPDHRLRPRSAARHRHSAAPSRRRTASVCTSRRP